MKKDLFKLFLIIFGIYVFLGDVRFLLNSQDKLKALEGIFSLKNLWYNLSFIVSFLSFGLFTFYVLSKYYPSRNKRTYIMLLIAGLIASVALRYFIEEILGVMVWGEGNYNPGTGLWFYFIDNCYYSILYGTIAMVYYFIKYSFKNEQEKMDLLVENKATQLQFLKSQVNPHFLFNNLNNIYSLVYKKSDNALPAIDKLSTLLRYSLYEADQNVTIDQEINQINNFVELQKLRSPKEVQFILDAEKIDLMQEIPPLIFFPFVENAFKHGDAYDSENPIRASIKKDNGNLIFSMSNKIKKQEKDDIGGIGLVNIKKRLQLIFGDNHSFKADQKNDLFVVLLKIPTAI